MKWPMTYVTLDPWPDPVCAVNMIVNSRTAGVHQLTHFTNDPRDQHDPHLTNDLWPTYSLIPWPDPVYDVNIIVNSRTADTHINDWLWLVVTLASLLLHSIRDDSLRYSSQVFLAPHRRQLWRQLRPVMPGCDVYNSSVWCMWHVWQLWNRGFQCIRGFSKVEIG